MSEEQLLNFHLSLQRRQNFSKYQDDLKKKMTTLKRAANVSGVTGNEQMSMANRVHYSAVNPYKDLQGVISKEKFLVP